MKAQRVITEASAQQAETDRVHKRHFTANPTVRERAEKLIRRKLLAKRKLSAGDLASMIRDRLDDFSCKITVYRAVSGSGSWYAVVYSSCHTPNANADRVRAIADELALVYDLA